MPTVRAIENETGRAERQRGAALSALATVLALAILAIYTLRIALPAARDHTNGFAAYFTAASLLAHSPHEMARIYDDAWFNVQVERTGFHDVQDIFNIQPPAMALLMLPLADLAPGTARLIWTLASLGFLIGGLALLARTLEHSSGVGCRVSGVGAGGSASLVRTLGLPLRRGVWILPLCLLFVPITQNLRSGQVYLFLFFLVCLLFWALQQPLQDGRTSRTADLIAGVALGLMLVLKTAGIWLWPLLLFSGRWRALLWAIAIAATVALVTLPLFGLQVWRIYFQLLPRLATEPQRYVTAYQTSTSLFGHLLIYNARWNPAPIANLPWLAQGLTAAILLLSLALSMRRERLNDTRPEVRALTLALFGALTVVSAPVSEGYHYTLLLPALIIACHYAWRERLVKAPGQGKDLSVVWREHVSRFSLAALVIATLLLGAPLRYQSHRLETGWLALFAYPRVYGAYLLWGWLCWTLSRQSSDRRSPSEEPIGLADHLRRDGRST